MGGNNMNEESRFSKKDLNEAKKEILKEIRQKVLEDGRYSIRNFGIFKLVHRKARVGRNPQNGEPIQIPEKDVVKFVPSKKFYSDYDDLEDDEDDE